MKYCSIDDCTEPHRARGMCKRHYNLWYLNGDPRCEKRVINNGVCSVVDCGKKARSRTAQYCEMHYYRMYRTGSIEGMQPYANKGLHEHSQGYLIESDKSHPVANKSGIYQHRRIFFDNYGHGPFRCHWCSKWVSWEDRMHIDHKDGNRKNNNLSNLVAACIGCNTLRGDPDREKSRRAHSRLIEFRGITKTESQWAKQLGIKSSSLRFRIANGWPLEKALTQTRGKTGPRVERQLVMDIRL